MHENADSNAVRHARGLLPYGFQGTGLEASVGKPLTGSDTL